MLSTIRKIANMYMKEYFQYKSLTILFTINRLIEVIVYVFVWLAIYNGKESVAGMDVNQMITYYVLMIFLHPLIQWGINEEIAHSIRKGQVQRELLNPIGYFRYCFGKELGEMGFALLVGCISIIICCFIWNIMPPSTIQNLISFIILILLNIPICFFIQMIVGICGFYTNSIWGMEILRRSTVTIFSGSIAPLTIFPSWIQSIANILPFKEFIYTPINIYLGNLGGMEIIGVFIKQVIWLIILYALAKLFFKKSVKQITVNGG